MSPDRRPVGLPPVLDTFRSDVVDLGLGRPSTEVGWPMLGWPMLAWGEAAEGLLLVDEYEERGALVVRADVPGIDPEKDLEVSAAEGTLHICVTCRGGEEEAERVYLRHELPHDERLRRDLALPEGADSSALRATYDNGVLEIRVPLVSRPRDEPRRVPVDRS